MPSGPKNVKYVNRHAAAANAREEEQKSNAAAARKRAEEEAKWEDDDKLSSKKAERAAEREAKAAAKAERKEENRALYEESTKTAKKGGAMAEFRRLQAEISKQAVEDLEERRRQERDKNDKNVNLDKSILERKNKNNNGDDDDDDNNGDKKNEINISLSSKDNFAANAQALEDILKGVDPTSAEFARKMGRRAKVLYKDFCDQNTKAVREANPSLRRTQLNDILWAMWQENAQNPFVQRKVALKAEKMETHRKWMENSGSDSEEPEGEGEAKK
jgi:hypothetical protein